jgi:hypothetical protein
MKLFAALKNAVTGWMLILQGNPDWSARFTRSAAGLATGLVILAFIAFLGVALASLGGPAPDAFQIIMSMLVLSLPFICMVFLFFGTRRSSQASTPSFDVLVPGAYLMAAFIVLEGLLFMLAPPLAMLSWPLLAYCLFRLARTSAQWHVALSTGFAILTVLLLVVARFALYIVSSANLSP